MSESVAMPGGSCGVSVRARLALYVVILVTLGSWVCFFRLERGMLLCDEASFAYTSDRMVRTGDWVVPYIHELRPHLNAAPLYNWLTNLTGPLFGDSNLRYRVWSAAFGVGCALAVLALGALLFRAEVGFVAGLFLLTNWQFVLTHGVRAGVMESALAFLVTAMAACYARTTQLSTRALPWWAFVGLFLGLATLAKPPVMGGFFFCMICLHHLATRTDLPWKARLTGPLTAGLVAAVVALPWYLAILARLGPGAIEHLVVANSIGRATRVIDSAQPTHYYLANVWQSSWGIAVALPAVALGIAGVLFGWNRRAWGLLAVLVVPFLAAISLATTKRLHYGYAAYPFLALATAGVMLAALTPRRSETPTGRWVWRGLALAGVAAAAFALHRDIRVMRYWLTAPRFDYPPFAAYRQLEPDLAAGRAQLVLYRYPDGTGRLDRKLGFTAHDRYYQDRMPHATLARDAAELNRLLTEGRPTVVLLPPLTPREEWLRDVALPPERAFAMSSDLFAYPVLTYHGAKVEEPRVGRKSRAGATDTKRLAE
jgi:4-amino-4-deoxy-L-arabinose transferase-like glycosyltransferase